MKNNIYYLKKSCRKNPANERTIMDKLLAAVAWNNPNFFSNALHFSKLGHHICKDCGNLQEWCECEKCDYCKSNYCICGYNIQTEDDLIIVVGTYIIKNCNNSIFYSRLLSLQNELKGIKQEQLDLAQSKKDQLKAKETYKQRINRLLKLEKYIQNNL